jgi:hypothetical protein
MVGVAEAAEEGKPPDAGKVLVVDNAAELA